MSSGIKPSKAKRVAADSKLVDGTQKHHNDLPASLTLDGKVVTPPRS